MFDWFGRRSKRAPEVTEAIELRDALLAEADTVTAEAREATKEVDRAQQRLIEDYASADRQRRKK